MSAVHPEQLLDALDEDQRRVAMQVTGPLAVLAGAGTGKTRAITYRIAHGVAVDAFDPANVLAVTFTTRAAAEMRLRLRDLGVPGAQARTFHSAALRQLRYFWPSAIGGRAPDIVERKASLIAAAAARTGLRNDKEAVRDFAAEIEWAKVAMVDAARYPERVRTLGREVPAGLSATQMATLMEAYEEAKNDRGVIDFADVLLIMAGILEQREDIARTVRAQYRHFVVDEYQDVSTLQQHLLDLWRGDRHDICVVGDVAQTIYTFAGASPQHLTSFVKRHPGARVIELNRDYRSTPQIVAVANQVITPGTSSRPGALKGAVRLVSQRPSGSAVHFDTYSDDAAQAQGVARTIASYAAQGIPLANMAILYRVNSQSESFEHELSQAGISYVVHGGLRFFEREDIRRAVLVLRRAALALVSSDEPQGPLPDLVADLLREVGWTSEAPAAGGALRESWDNLNALVELAKDREKVSLSDFVAELEERAESQAAPAVEGVTLSTLHASKGLEWDVVFLVGTAEGTLPISMATTPREREEERRLLYVGVTRARDHLHMSWAKRRSESSHRSVRKRSRLLDGIWPEEAPTVTGASQKAAKTASRLQKKEAQAAFEEESDDATLARFDALKAWRLERARDMSLPAFAVFTDQTLRDIATANPKTLKQLRIIRGVGDTKLQSFGGDVLRVIRDL